MFPTQHKMLRHLFQGFKLTDVCAIEANKCFFWDTASLIEMVASVVLCSLNSYLEAI